MSGGEHIIWEIDPATDGERKVMEAAAKALRQTLYALAGHIRNTLTGQRHGEHYRRHGRVHVASAPGEPPAVDTGNLRGSVAAQSNITLHGAEATGTVSISAEYAMYLEKGTGRMAARPFAERTLKDKWSELQDYFAKVFKGYFA